MATRTIRTGIGTYQRVDGHWTFGMLGAVVDVHDDDAERFDRLNLPTAAAADVSNEETVDEGIYKRVSVKDLKADLAARNEGREDDAKIIPAEPGNRPEIIAALIADDQQ